MFKVNDIMVKKYEHQVEQPFVEHSKNYYSTFEFFNLRIIYLQCIFI
jgi:hypothetical protein